MKALKILNRRGEKTNLVWTILTSPNSLNIVICLLSVLENIVNLVIHQSCR